MLLLWVGYLIRSFIQLLRVKKNIDEFVGDAVQFDDITMLCLDYFGKGSGTDDGTDA